MGTWATGRDTPPKSRTRRSVRQRPTMQAGRTAEPCSSTYRVSTQPRSTGLYATTEGGTAVLRHIQSKSENFHCFHCTGNRNSWSFNSDNAVGCRNRRFPERAPPLCGARPEQTTGQLPSQRENCCWERAPGAAPGCVPQAEVGGSIQHAIEPGKHHQTSLAMQ